MRKETPVAHILEEYDATEVVLTPLVEQDDLRVTIATFGPRGTIGGHPTGVDQIFHVVSGHGWASGADGRRVPLVAGEQVVWTADEEHASGSASGMTALIIQGEGLVG